MVKPNIIKTSENPLQTIEVEVFDEYGEKLTKQIACERPLTVMLNWKEIVTLMTLGSRPESLVLGYLKNQSFLSDPEAVESIIIDWETSSAAVITKEDTSQLEQALKKKTVTSGCGQGTMFGNVMKQLEDYQVPQTKIKQSEIYTALEALTHYNDTYKKAGAVHGCAVCKDDKVLSFVEDVGRHNAVDTLAGEMWLNKESGEDKIFYTTGRLTSEMVIKVAQMGIPVLLSRSGVTQMGLDLAQQFGITTIARAKGLRFQVFTGADKIDFDVKGEQSAPGQKA
ncbi:formate dehydrogenase accessory sulfurtransferase FdhD [Vibrio cyclitrophicus]|uniref:formate dehydrogenase accessory sulfurtransferase FdhD n=1 Tax=Vibrio cyclitrophicus TaxID=47951 RepID=UPI0002E43F75|nr:formate dehydrogenase accessory sulfurtransferase FdhD [Vibrio cyclitrophicus]OED99391.1 formate dehydrogenase family accessory protein FdhD [Vibrio cyclitrophicus ZF28]OEF40606.1 formate dehydrogenase family accessory protein FdhD [Vibrio cyclitrophicus 1F289]PME16026.1 formate dehydrogenase family accessory protein FdhD [Vibrio cyclitrophicus]PMF11213.1 formate dehydrogenase family accessory protein FdhD [Vibrio cyclitrophicus]PMG84123.1 formate dehydrogenase family accessory protein FdhD